MADNPKEITIGELPVKTVIDPLDMLIITSTEGKSSRISAEDIAEKISDNVQESVNTRISTAEEKIDSIYEQFSLANGAGTFNASTNSANVKETGENVTLTSVAAYPIGKYFDVIVPGTTTITGSSVNAAVGGRIVSRGTKWDYIPPADTGYAKAVTLEKEIAIYQDLPLVSLGGTAVNGGVINLAAASMSIPNGQVGNSTYLSRALTLSAFPALTVGKEILFSAVLFENIAAITAPDRPRFQINVVRNGSTQFNQGSDFTMERLTATSVKYTCRYTVQTGDTVVTPLFQHQLTTANSSGTTWTWTWNSLFYYASKVSASNTLSEKLIDLQAGIAANSLKSDIFFSIAPASFSGEGLAGGVLNTALGKISIPAGQTGLNSYARGIFPISLFSNWEDMVGKLCTFQWTILTSDNITDTRTFKISIAVARNGSSVNDVGSSSSLVKLSASLYEAKVTYTPQAGDTEVRLVAQINNNVVAVADQFFDLDQFYYTNVAPAGYPSQATYPLAKMLGKIKTDITANTDSISAANKKSDIQIPVTPYTYSGQLANGGLLDAVPGKLVVPVGQTGQNSYVRGQFSYLNFPAWSDMVGIPCAFQYIVYTSTDLTDTRTLAVNMSVTRNGTTVNFVAAGTFTKLTPNIGIASFTYTPQAGDTDLRPFVQFANNYTVTGADQWISLGQFFVMYATPAGYPSQATYAVTKQIAKSNVDIEILKAGGSVVTLTVAPDGSKQFLSPKLANDSITDSSLVKWYEIIVYPGIYTETEWIVKPYTRIIGTNNRTCWLKGENADNATDALISNTSTLWLQRTSELHNLRVSVKNGRYAIHDEESGGNANSTHRIQSCKLEHLGNDSARAWRTANPGSGMSAGTVWTSEHPYGCGTGSGVVLDFANVTSIGPNSGFFFHTNKDFSKPNINKLTGCNLVRTGAWGTAINAQALGSGQKDRVELTSCQILGGYINQTDTPWITTDPTLQIADKAEIDFHIRGGNAVGYIDNTRGKALRIRSNKVSGASTVRVSGTAAAAVFGTAVDRDGNGGLRGYTYGYWDISGILVGLAANVSVNNTIGRLLGDCSTVNKTLTVVVDSGAPINIVFNTNLTSVSNATILATINAALGSNAVADEFSSSNLYYPQMYDRQIFGKNATATGIPKGSAVAYDANIQNIRICTASDTPADFIGITLEDINPNATGRVLTEGVMHYSQITGILQNALVFNTVVSLGETSGNLTAGGAKKIGKGLALDWMYFKGSL